MMVHCLTHIWQLHVATSLMTPDSLCDEGVSGGIPWRAHVTRDEHVSGVQHMVSQAIGATPRYHPFWIICRYLDRYLVISKPSITLGSPDFLRNHNIDVFLIQHGGVDYVTALSNPLLDEHLSTSSPPIRCLPRLSWSCFRFQALEVLQCLHRLRQFLGASKGGTQPSEDLLFFGGNCQFLLGTVMIVDILVVKP